MATNKRVIDRQDKLKKAFIVELEKFPNVSLACKNLNLVRATVYAWREKDAEFRAAWENAWNVAMDNLEQECYRRAMVGHEKPVYQGGRLVGTTREFSDTLAIFLLKGGKPEKYRERFEHSGPRGGPIQTVDLSNLETGQLEQLAQILTATDHSEPE